MNTNELIEYLENLVANNPEYGEYKVIINETYKECSSISDRDIRVNYHYNILEIF